MILEGTCNLYYSDTERERERKWRRKDANGVSYALDDFKSYPIIICGRGCATTGWDASTTERKKLPALRMRDADKSLFRTLWMGGGEKRVEQEESVITREQKERNGKTFSYELSRKRVIFMGNVWGLQKVPPHAPRFSLSFSTCLLDFGGEGTTTKQRRS